jgi:hypothetical protein
MSPGATRHILDADYIDEETLEELTARFGSAGLEDDDDIITDFSTSPVSSSGSSLSYRSDSSSPSSSLSGYSTPGSEVSCTCERYGITRKGDRVKIDCGGEKCGFSCSSGEEEEESDYESESDEVPAPARRHGMVVC